MRSGHRLDRYKGRGRHTVGEVGNGHVHHHLWTGGRAQVENNIVQLLANDRRDTRRAVFCRYVTVKRTKRCPQHLCSTMRKICGPGDVVDRHLVSDGNGQQESDFAHLKRPTRLDIHGQRTASSGRVCDVRAVRDKAARVHRDPNSRCSQNKKKIQ